MRTRRPLKTQRNRETERSTDTQTHTQHTHITQHEHTTQHKNRNTHTDTDTQTHTKGEETCVCGWVRLWCGPKSFLSKKGSCLARTTLPGLTSWRVTCWPLPDSFLVPRAYSTLPQRWQVPCPIPFPASTFAFTGSASDRFSLFDAIGLHTDSSTHKDTLG